MTDLLPMWSRCLTERAELNGSVELAPPRAVGAADDAEPPASGVPTRVLAFDAETTLLTIERVLPRGDAPGLLHRGGLVDVLVIEQGHRLLALHRVQDIAPFNLNEQRRVVAAQLCRLGPVVSGQRRAHFRVDVVGVADDLGCALIPVGHDGEPVGPPVAATLVNLSGGGLGAALPTEALNMTAPLGGRYRVRLARADLGAPVEFAATVVRAAPTKGGTLFIGLRFQHDDSNEGQRAYTALTRLTNVLQRQQLRRRRGA